MHVLLESSALAIRLPACLLSIVRFISDLVVHRCLPEINCQSTERMLFVTLSLWSEICLGSAVTRLIIVLSMPKIEEGRKIAGMLYSTMMTKED